MALTSFIPKVWSARMLRNLDTQLVYARAINRDYQPDAVFGNVISTSKMGAVTIGDYVKDTDMDAAETLDSVETTITINQQKYFNLAIDSIDEAQSKPNLMDAAMGRASFGMANVVDTYIASLYSSFTAGTGLGTAGVPVTPTVDDVYEYLTLAAQILDERNVPVDGRYAILNAAGIKLLKDSGVFLSDTPAGDTVRFNGTFQSAGSLPMGYKGKAAGFDLLFSNKTPTDDVASSVWTFGHSEGISMVDSINEVVGYTPELRFGDAVKGLYVYGAAVTQPAAGVAMFTSL